MHLQQHSFMLTTSHDHVSSQAPLLGKLVWQRIIVRKRLSSYRFYGGSKADGVAATAVERLQVSLHLSVTNSNATSLSQLANPK